MSVPIPPAEAKRLKALRQFNILDTPAEQSFDDFALLASTICKTPIATMTLIDSDRQWFKAKVGIESSETPREYAFCAYTILDTQVLVVEDATKDERFASNPLVKSAPHIRFYAGAPLIDGEGNALGSLCVIDRQARVLEPAQRTALEALARQVIATLEFRRVAAQLAEALTDVRTLRGLIPICAHCKGIRNDAGFWESVEKYVMTHSDAKFSHGICPECMKREHPDYYAELKAEGEI